MQAMYTNSNTIYRSEVLLTLLACGFREWICGNAPTTI